MKYRFKIDFPPTDWKKGDIYNTDEIVKYDLPFTSFLDMDIGLLLHLGIIEEIKEDKPLNRAGK